MIVRRLAEVGAAGRRQSERPRLISDVPTSHAQASMTHAAITGMVPGSRILIIDDDRDTAETMARFLRTFGHEVQIAFDGYQALDVARRERPGYVLLDLGLPGMDGYQVASQLRREFTEPLVIIAITGYGREEDQRRCREAGIDHHRLKPVDLTALLTLLSPSQTASS